MDIDTGTGILTRHPNIEVDLVLVFSLYSSFERSKDWGVALAAMHWNKVVLSES